MIKPASLLVSFVLLTGCASKLETPPETAEVVADALPETTEVVAEWSAPAADTGAVDDDWLKTFNDPELEALVEEALHERNPNMRFLAAQVDRANAAARAVARRPRTSCFWCRARACSFPLAPGRCRS